MDGYKQAFKQLDYLTQNLFYGEGKDQQMLLEEFYKQALFWKVMTQEEIEQIRPLIEKKTILNPYEFIEGKKE